MKKIITKSLITASVVFFMQGCYQESVFIEPNIKKSYTSDSTIGLNDTIKKISGQLLSSLNESRDKLGVIAITSFVDLHQLNKTTHFGRILGESFYSELYTKGIKVSDFRGRHALSINANGEFFLSRSIKKIKNKIPNKYILVGTYSRVKDGVIINARILDNASGELISAARVIFKSNDCREFGDCKEREYEGMGVLNIVADNCELIDCSDNTNASTDCRITNTCQDTNIITNKANLIQDTNIITNKANLIGL
jgi:TolB-like protein